MAILDELRDRAAPLTARLAPAALDDLEAPSARSGLVGWLADLGGPGVVEFLLLNQSALALALVNRSPRLNGVGLADLQGKMNAPTRQPAVATLSLTPTAGLADDADPDNWFFNPGDTDYDSYNPLVPTSGEAVGVDASQSGVSYGYSTSRGTMTIYNDGDEPIGVLYVVRSEAGNSVEEFTLIEAGSQAEFSGQQGTYLVQGRRQDANGVATADGEVAAVMGVVVFASTDGVLQAMSVKYDATGPLPLSPHSDPVYPYLVVNAGPVNPVTGVTFIRVDSQDVGGGAVSSPTVTQPAHGTVEWAEDVQEWRYTVDPAKASIGEVVDSVTFSVTDASGVTVSKTVDIVTPKHDPSVNHAPVVLGTTPLPRPTGQVWQDFQVNAVDDNGDALDYRVITDFSPGSALNHGTVEHLGGGVFRYTPTDPATLREGDVADWFVVEVDDGRGGTARHWVNPIYQWGELDNVAPVIDTESGGLSISTDGGYSYTFTGSDADGDDLYWYVSDLPEYGAVRTRTAEDGSFVVTYYPDRKKAHNGAYSDTFTVTVLDEFGGTDSRDVTISVDGYNTNPWLSVSPENDGFVADEDLVWVLQHGDEDGDPVQVTAASTDGGDVRIVDGKLSYTPKPQVNGGWLHSDGIIRGYYVDVVKIEVTDDHGGSSVQERRVAVVDTSWAPWVDPDKAVILVVDLDHRPEFQGFVDGGIFSGTVPLENGMNDDFVAYLSSTPLAAAFAEYDAMLLTARYCAANDCGTVEEPEEPGDPTEPGTPGGSWLPGSGFGNWLPPWRLPQTAPGEDVVNAQWERDWEQYTMMVGFFPVVGTVLNGISFGMNAGQLINAIGRGDNDDIADEVADLIGDTIGFIPVGGRVAGNVLEPYLSRPIGTAVGDLIQAGVGNAVGTAVGTTVRVVGDGIAGFFWGVGNGFR
ncbi:hypothetical protein MUG78_03530 [Gordonia alkaliphila]|uniref:Ig-like domain-containing protein n=1 Tax=Gordonia alkaliphila TaxID=1053547 RepID=UPI001FF4CF72|nr:hypothetical protein [Gordonia alkaliphila]MCK0438557.1 hypothetical protein [Gordonia alkaliphila]